MLARLRGVARRHKAMGLQFVSLTTVVMAADGLVQEHIDVHGTDSLMPKSKEPFHTSELMAMLALPVGTEVACGGGSVVVGPGIEWQGVRVFIALFATMGCRKEAIALDAGQQFGWRTLSFHHLTYRIGGALVRSPTEAQLLAMRDGDVVYITPCPCKNDPTGAKFGNHPVPSAYHSTRSINLARELVRYELARQVDAGQLSHPRFLTFLYRRSQGAP
jgi:hypothetical protein